jgi:hypothetical protein
MLGVFECQARLVLSIGPRLCNLPPVRDHKRHSEADSRVQAAITVLEAAP